jgi:hypothetical protein
VILMVRGARISDSRFQIEYMDNIEVLNLNSYLIYVHNLS